MAGADRCSKECSQITDVVRVRLCSVSSSHVRPGGLGPLVAGDDVAFGDHRTWSSWCCSYLRWLSFGGLMVIGGDDGSVSNWK